MIKLLAGIFAFLYVAIYLNGYIVKQKNYISFLENELETRTYEFQVCKKLYKIPLTCPKK